MTRKRQPAPRPSTRVPVSAEIGRPSTRVPVSEEKLAEIEREAEQRLQHAKRQRDLTAHLKAIAGVYQTYHRVHLEGAKLRILVEQGWSSPQIAAALDPDGVERKTYELKAEKEARQASRVRNRLCKGLREEIVRIQKVRMLYEQRVGQISTTTAKNELDRLIAERERNAKRTRKSRIEDERMHILAAIIDIDSIIQSMQAKLDELERRRAWSQGRSAVARK